MRINNKLLFEVWASDEEKAIFEDILKLVHSWNGKYVEASLKKDKANIPDFGKLNDDISNKVYQLAKILRKEVENQI